MKLLVLFSIFISSLVVVYAEPNCSYFLSVYNTSKTLVAFRRAHEKLLQSDGFVMEENDIGYTEESSDLITFSENCRSEYFNTAARLVADKNRSDLSSFGSYAPCLGRFETELNSWPKYRTINGYGNNLKHPYWGMTGTTFARFGPKSYDDGIHEIRRSIDGSPLPCPRKLVQEVLLKAEKTPRNTTETPNAMLNLIVLYVTHDLAHQVPVEAFEPNEKIRCCTSENKNVLPVSLSHSACLPVPISEKDPFYGPAGVRCLNLIRSELSASPSTLEYGEIMNKATSFMDHSIIYGTQEAETIKIRTFVDGKLNVGSKNILPMDYTGRYTISTDRLTAIPIGAIYPVMFTRFHNSLTDGLKSINPHWNDETLFQEARRINIAVFQRFITGGVVIEAVAKKRVKESYKGYNPSVYAEFSTAAYRFLHYFLQPDMLLVKEDNSVESIKISDTLGRINIIEERFEDALRGILSQPANFGQYSDEVYQKVAKNKDGVGIDLLSIDIQRGRDHGLPTFLDARRACNFSDIKTFDELLTIFPQSYVDLLKKSYNYVEDIDLYVGGALESFTTINEVLVGATFGCIIGEQYRRTMGGDAYFYTHKTSPYPFTDEQLKIISDYSVSHLICSTTGLEKIQYGWGLVASATNPKVPCSLFPPMNLTSWKE